MKERKIFWKIRCFVAWTFAIVGMFLGAAMFSSYFFFKIGILNGLYAQGIGPLLAVSCAVACFLKIIGALITWTNVFIFPRFHDKD